MLSVYRLCPLLWFNLTCPPGGCPKASKRLLSAWLWLGSWGWDVGRVISCVLFETHPESTTEGGQQALPERCLYFLPLTITTQVSQLQLSTGRRPTVVATTICYISWNQVNQIFLHTPPLYFLICSGQNRKSIYYHGAVSGETEWLCQAELIEDLYAYQRSSSF